MGETKRRVFFYLFLAIACYAMAAVLGEGRIGFMAFFIVGVIAELVFWRHLFLRVRRWFAA